MTRLLVLALLVALGGASAVALAAADDLHLASRTSDAAVVPADDDSRDPSLSADGRLVAFESQGDNLVAGDDDVIDNVFLRDITGGTTRNVHQVNGSAAYATGSSATEPVVSADGSCVAFGSQADDLTTVPGDDDDYQVYVRILATNETILVSRETGADGDPGDEASRAPSVSADCRRVAFHSNAGNFTTGENEGVLNTFVRDLQANTTTWVSQATNGDGADANAADPSISGDGRYVAFETADELHPNDTNGTDDVYVRDLEANTTEIASRATASATAAVGRDPSISSDGRFVAFESVGTAYTDQDVDASADIFVRDMQSGTTTFASRANGADGAGGDGDSRVPSISGDGRRVAFESDSNNLGDDDGNGDVYVRDIVANTTVQASRAAGANGELGGGTSEAPAMSANGLFVAFVSSAGLGFGTEGEEQIFVRDLGSAAPPPGNQPPPPPPPPPGDTGPAVGKPSAKCAKRKGSDKPCRITISFRVTRAATVKLLVARLARGRKPKKLGTLTRRVRPPRAKLLLPAKVKGKRLKQGRYRITLKLGRRTIGKATVQVR